MSVYTKKGDNGDTSLPNMENIPKSNPIFEILGTIDELNAILAFLNPSKLQKINDVVVDIQKDLFSMGAAIACKSSSEDDYYRFEKRVTKFEELMDKLDESLPQLKHFVLPGGSYEACYLNLARAVCRRLERVMVGNDVDLRLIKYINRLSDLLFVLSRSANVSLDVKEVTWDGSM